MIPTTDHNQYSTDRKNVEGIILKNLAKKFNGIKKYLYLEFYRAFLSKRIIVMGKTGSGKSVFTLTKLLPKYLLLSDSVCYIGYKDEYIKHVFPFLTSCLEVIRFQTAIEFFDIHELNKNPIDGFTKISNMCKQNKNSLIVIDEGKLSAETKDLFKNIANEFRFMILVTQGESDDSETEILPLQYFNRIYRSAKKPSDPWNFSVTYQFQIQ